MKLLKLTVILSAAFASFGCKSGYVDMPASDFQKLISEKDVLLIDVRTPEEFAESHIPGAVNIDFRAEDFDQKAVELLKETQSTLAVYCRSGRRSAGACARLDSMGYTRTVNLLGGILEWKEAGYEIEDPDTEYAKDLLPKGTPAPDFTLPTPDGEQLTLSSFRGHYVVLDFWASWCPDCRKDLPDLQAAYARYQEKGVVFIGVSLDDDKAKWTEAVSKFGLTYPQVSELKKWKETDISPLYHIRWIPTMYVIDPEGNVVIGTVMAEKIISTIETMK